MIGIIAAVSSNGVIGINNKLPFYYKEDLQFFKNKTLNSTIIMGRKTYESIGKPLPGRKTVVISSNDIYGIECYRSLDEAISHQDKKSDVWLCGGQSIYKSGMNFADVIFLTITPDIIIASDNDSLVYFPWINPIKFKELCQLNLGEHLKVVKFNRVRDECS